ncbi:MAG TPA: glycosyltransferase family 4 protein [Candidatus Dormibacteraeota bacterium]|nr:glycosyltransferase family 4 protein [Candidatus Dormibacteraeota bacterium]
MILGVFPELNRVGGIQQVSRHAGAALCELAGRTGETCELLSLNDPATEDWFRVGRQRFPFRGFARHKSRFVAHLMIRAPRTRLLFAAHIYFGPPAFAAAALGPHLRYWLMAHGFEVWQPLPLYRAVPLRQAHGVIAVSRNTAEAVEREQKVPREKIFLLPPALEPAALEPDIHARDASGSPVEAASLGVPPGSHLLLTVARLAASEPGKGVDTVIQAMPQLLPCFPDLFYVIVGDGDGRPGLEKLVIENGVGERVIFAGECPKQSLRRYYEIADVFVMPSRQEGFGIVFLEAMAAGKPVVASACGGAPEVVRDGEDGYLVEYGDVSALAARLAGLLGDKGLRRRMGEAGRRKTEEQYQFEHFRDRLIAILEAGKG